MEAHDGPGSRQRIAAAVPATLDRDLQRRTQDDVMERHGQRQERPEEPRADDAVDDDEVPAPGITLGHRRQGADHHLVLCLGLGQIGSDRAVLDEMPEVVGVEVNLR